MEENSESTAPNDVDDSLSFLESELEALESIYINEIQVKQDDDQNCTCVSIDLHPATADKPEEQYVKMTLKFTLSEEYPHSIPEISIRNPRGLSDEKINSTYQDLISIAEKKIGNSMLFEIIEAAKEHLTAGNRPCGECAICLYGFSESDVFIKTDCYHYFHGHCLARYAKNAIESEEKEGDSSSDDAANNELLCPMCRVPIQFTGVDESYPPPSTGDDECLISEQILEMQKKMADLYQKQLEKGGIIDIEAEKNKFLLEISNVPTLTNSVEKPDTAAEENDTSVKADENASNISQLSLNDKAQNSKEAKSAAIKSDEKHKHNKRFNKRGYHNSHSNFPRNNRKPKLHYDSYNEDFDDEESFRHGVKDQNRTDIETVLPQNKDSMDGDPHSKFSSSGKERQRSSGHYGPRRGNQNGYNRGNYSRYPRKNAMGHNSNQRHFDQAHQDTRRSNSGKDVSPQSDSSKNTPDSPLEETNDFQAVENGPDSSRRHSNEFDRRGKNRGRFPRNNQRGRGGNYTNYAPRRDNYARNRMGDNYQSRREQDSSDSHYANDVERDSKAVTEDFCEDNAQSHRDAEANVRSYRNNPRKQSRGNSHRDSGSTRAREGTARQEENSHRAEYPGDNDPVDHDHCSPEDPERKFPEKRPDPRRNAGPQEGNLGRNSSRQAPESSEFRDGRRFNSYKSNDHQQTRDRNQYHNRRNDYEENERQYQRYDNYSQNGAPRRNNPRDGYFNNPNADRRGGYQQDRGGRGRNNRFQNRNSGFEGGHRRNQHNQDDSTIQNNRHYRSAPRKSEDSYSNASARNGRFNESRTVDDCGAQMSLEVSVDTMNGLKSFDESEVKAFVPKEDSCVPFSGEPDSHSQKVSYPPPGFSNPHKKVVYGLEAAKPPPGFPRR